MLLQNAANRKNNNFRKINSEYKPPELSQLIFVGGPTLVTLETNRQTKIKKNESVHDANPGSLGKFCTYETVT